MISIAAKNIRVPYNQLLRFFKYGIHRTNLLNFSFEYHSYCKQNINSSLI